MKRDQLIFLALSLGTPAFAFGVSVAAFLAVLL